MIESAQLGRFFVTPRPHMAPMNLNATDPYQHGKSVVELRLAIHAQLTLLILANHLGFRPSLRHPARILGFRRAMGMAMSRFKRATFG